MSKLTINPTHKAILSNGQFITVELLETRKRLFRSPKYLVAHLTNHQGSKAEVVSFFGSPIPIPGSESYMTKDTAWVTKLYPLDKS